MAELAYNGNGDPFDVPETVTGWRVRRMKARGAPEVVYGRDGLPLTIDVSAELDDLRREVDEPGRYRLEPVGDDRRAIDGVQVAYVQVMATLAVAQASVEAARVADESISVMREAMRLNTDLARAVVDRFPAMLEASAVLLRAADGAGLPARLPLAVAAVDDGDEDEDDGQDDDASAAPAVPGPFGGFDLNALVAQIVPLVINKVMSGGLDLSNLGALLDWRKAAPKAKATTDVPTAARRAPSAAAKPAPSTPTEPANTNTPATPVAPTIDPAAMLHFLAIQNALGAKDAAMARAIAAELTPAEQQAWIGELSALSVPEAVAKVRAVLAGGGDREAVS